MEAWYDGQIGQDRYSRTGVSERRPNGIFPPVDVVRMLSEVLPLMSPYGGFLYLNHGICLHGLS